MNQAVELPEPVWSALQQAAKSSGVSTIGWIAAHLPAPADANGACAEAEEEGADVLESPTYSSFPLECVGTVQAECRRQGTAASPLPT